MSTGYKNRKIIQNQFGQGTIWETGAVRIEKSSRINFRQKKNINTIWKTGAVTERQCPEVVIQNSACSICLEWSDMQKHGFPSSFFCWHSSPELDKRRNSSVSVHANLRLGLLAYVNENRPIKMQILTEGIAQCFQQQTTLYAYNKKIADGRRHRRSSVQRCRPNIGGFIFFCRSLHAFNTACI